MGQIRAIGKRWGITAAAVAITAIVVHFVAMPAQIQSSAPVPYRVELVHNDQYKVSTALNNMSKEGWYYVSSISRNDSKVLLVFRRSQ